MKYLLPLLCCCLVADAQSFKVYELLIPKDKIESFSNPQEMIEAAGRGGATITAYADLPESKDGVWSIDQTYSVRYAEELDDQGDPVKFADRKVGLEVQIKELDDGIIDFTYCHTKLEAWIPFSLHQGALQPIFSTREITPGPFKLDDYIIMGGLVTQDGVLHIIIQKIASK